MTLRSMVLFTHVVGMLAFFIGLAFEWLSVERMQKMLPRIYGIAFATLLVSGGFLARRVGLFQFAWLRSALALMIVIGVLGMWRASLFVRAALALAVVYLMIGKPPLGGSMIVTGVAMAIGVAISLVTTTAAGRRSPQKSA